MGWIAPGVLRGIGILGMNCRNVNYISRYNEREYYPLVDDKLKTKVVAEDAGLAAPKLIHVVSLQHEIEAIDELLLSMDEFVVKPANGSGGKGILVIVGREGDEFVKSSGSHISIAEIKRHLTNIISGLHSLGGKQDVAFIEELVKVDPIFNHYSFEGVPDIRLIVFKGFPIMGMLRLATVESDGKANLHQGAVGVGLDIATGRAIQAVQHNKVITHHPDTGADLSKLAIPNWRSLLELASRCYEATELGYLGCDIVLDARKGPLILELNARPGLSIQIANNAGLLPPLRHLESFDTRKMVLEERVDYAIEKFGNGDET